MLQKLKDKLKPEKNDYHLNFWLFLTFLQKPIETTFMKIADFLNRYNKYCWAGLVHFGMCQNLGELKEPCGERCRKESIENGFCYCGKFKDGKTFLETEKEKAKWD